MKTVLIFKINKIKNGYLNVFGWALTYDYTSQYLVP